ncbi:hypothetical protein D6C00_13900 [Thiohalobacter thiocyanaticus]|uniref:Uncharacterized protein n=1 Tax=Thiohalobacter thiocyanaticus TaxID=585455 RepID=A0A426QMB6_9GAMM|nr:hypothetical protein D6C00_13900 [Thiohalobacter thiocyanaticus]
MASEAAETRTYRLSHRLTVEITAGPGGMVCEWDPARPERLTGKELKAYRRARQEVLQRLAERTGSNVLVLEMEGMNRRRANG